MSQERLGAVCYVCVYVCAYVQGRLTNGGIKWWCVITGAPSVVKNLNSRVACCSEREDQ